MSGTKIAFTGPECSGKSTMAKWLAKELSYEIVDEYAREYLKDKSAYSIDDLDMIAAEQFERNSVDGSLVIDTEMLVMKIWSKEKYQGVSKKIIQLLKRQRQRFRTCNRDWATGPPAVPVYRLQVPFVDARCQSNPLAPLQTLAPQQTARHHEMPT